MLSHYSGQWLERTSQSRTWTLPCLWSPSQFRFSWGWLSNASGQKRRWSWARRWSDRYITISLYHYHFFNIWIGQRRCSSLARRKSNSQHIWALHQLLNSDKIVKIRTAEYENKLYFPIFWSEGFSAILLCGSHHPSLHRYLVKSLKWKKKTENKYYYSHKHKEIETKN